MTQAIRRLKRKGWPELERLKRRLEQVYENHHTERNAGFIRQAGKPHRSCRMNPAFRWWYQDAPFPEGAFKKSSGRRGHDATVQVVAVEGSLEEYAFPTARQSRSRRRHEYATSGTLQACR